MDARPKTLLYAEAMASVERRIVEALPEIIDGLIARARGGDVKAAVYLCDRILGRVAGSATAPADDRRAPYTEEAFALDQEERKSEDDMRQFIARLGASRGA